jgi:F420H(2)-dependent quinone reductase
MSELALGREPVLADAVAGRLIELAGVECSRRNRSGCFALMDDRCPSTDEEQSVHLDLAYADARTGLDRRPARIEHWLDALSVRPAAWLLRRTGGRAARLWRRRALVLTTRGRRTGRARSVPLQYFPDGDEFVVVAANSGLAAPPAWYLNLRAHPSATIDVDGRTRAVRAAELPRDEARAFWPRVLEQAPDYARYPRRTNRPIALVRLVPTTAHRDEC